MNLEKAIEIRRSRRKYANTPIEPQTVIKLRELIAEYSETADLHIELVLNNGKAFNGLRKSYGMFSGVNDYLGLIAAKGDTAAAERLGYYGELLMLHAVTMGLGTCWVAGSFSRSDMPFSLSDNESLVCTVVVGNVADDDSFKEKMIRNMTHRKTKSAEEMYTADSPVPDWFTQGMKAVEKAPSAVNRQPVLFSYKDSKVSAVVKNIGESSNALDFGIAKLHFEIGAGGGKWAWGNDGEFTRQSSR
jgi:nitroreductase